MRTMILLGGFICMLVWGAYVLRAIARTMGPPAYQCWRCQDELTCLSHCEHEMFDGDCPECRIPKETT